MRNGVLPNRYDTRDYSFERTFGATLPSDLPKEYNADNSGRVPDQVKDGFPNGCTGYTQNATGELEYQIESDPAFVYGNTLLIGDLPPHSPCQIRDSFKATKVYGLKSGTTDPLTYRRGNYFDVDKVGDYFDGVRSALWLNREARRCVSVGTPWFREWAISRAVMRPPKKYTWDSDTIGHNYMICGWKEIEGEPYLIVKPWLGRGWGDNGYGYLSREIFNKVMGISGTFMYIQVNYTHDQIKTIKIDILELILSLLRRLMIIKQPLPLMPEVKEKGTRAGEQLLHTAKLYVGQDVTPKDEVSDDLACVAQLQEVHRKATGSYIGTGAALYNTGALYEELQSNHNFLQVTSPLPGDIVISPTGYSTKGSKHGHCGIVAETHILSNTSKNGKWEANYTLDSWDAYYGKKLGFPVYFYRAVDN